MLGETLLCKILTTHRAGLQPPRPPLTDRGNVRLTRECKSPWSRMNHNRLPQSVPINRGKRMRVVNWVDIHGGIFIAIRAIPFLEPSWRNQSHAWLGYENRAGEGPRWRTGESGSRVTQGSVNITRIRVPKNGKASPVQACGPNRWVHLAVSSP